MRMTPRKFAKLLDARGGALDAWPGRDGDAARALLVRSAEARALHERTLRMGRFLGEALVALNATDAACRRVAAIPLTHPSGGERRSGGMLRPRFVWYGATAATAASLAAGIVVGALSGGTVTADEQIADLDALVFGITDTEGLL